MKLFWAIIILFSGIAIGVGWAHLSDENRGEAHWAQDDDEAALAMAEQDVMQFDGPRSPRFADEVGQTARARVLSTTDREEGVSEQAESDDAADTESAKADERDQKRELVEDLLTERNQADDERDDGSLSAPAPGATPAGPPGMPDGAGGPPLRGDHEDHTEPQQTENPWKDGAPIEGDDAPGRLEHSIEKRDDGTIILDDMFEVRGSGTRNDPYQVTWDLLMSAAETYQPRLGMDEIPERIMMLDGKYVQITGHLLFPMASFETDEVLVMLNMWDGCCLGTMPSPYDALEVQLSDPVRADARQAMSYGSLTGRLSVDPYLINDWLIGLYVVEDGTLRMDM